MVWCRKTDAQKMQYEARTRKWLYNQPGCSTTDRRINPPKMACYFACNLKKMYYLRVNKIRSSTETLTYIFKYPNSYRRYYYTGSTTTVCVSLTVGTQQY